MRKWAYLKEPYHINETDTISKIMIREQKKGAFVYLYCAKDAVMCSFGRWYPDLESALEDRENEIDSEGWHIINDTLPDCLDDCIVPIRVKGKAEHNPQWGKYEILQDGIWIDYPI